MAGQFQNIVQGVGRRYELMKAAHDEMGHKGVFAVKARLQDRFWWPKMNEDISWYIQTCHACQTRQMRKIHTPLVIQPPAVLFSKAYFDIMHMPSAGRFTYIIQA